MNWWENRKAGKWKAGNLRVNVDRFAEIKLIFISPNGFGRDARNGRPEACATRGIGTNADYGISIFRLRWGKQGFIFFGL